MLNDWLTLPRAVLRFVREIAREDRRAATEGQRQAAVFAAYAEAEATGVSARRIAGVEAVESFAESFGVASSGQGIALATGNELANLIRDLSLATQAGEDPDAQAALLAATRLRNRRQREGETAVLSRDEISTFIQGVDGQFVSPADVTREQQLRITQAIESQAREARGLERTLTASAIEIFGKETPFVRGAFAGAAAEGSDAAREIVAELRKTNALQRQALELMQESADASASNARQLIQNTSPVQRSAVPEIQRNAVRTIPDPM